METDDPLMHFPSSKILCIYHPSGSDLDFRLLGKNKILVKHYRPTINGIEFCTPAIGSIWIYAPPPVIYLVLADKIVHSHRVRGIIVDCKRKVSRTQLWLMRLILLKERWLLGSDVESPTLRRQQKRTTINYRITIGDWLEMFTKIEKLQKANAKPIVEYKEFINGLDATTSRSEDD